MKTIGSLLVSAVTEYDRQQSTRRGYNPHALGIYLQRVDEIMADIDRGADARSAIIRGFNDRLLDFVLKRCGLPVASVEEHKRGPLTYTPAI